MNLIVPGNWTDLGYRKLPSLPRAAPDYPAAKAAQLLGTRAGYEIQDQTFVRRTGRQKTTSLPKALSIAAIFDRTTPLEDSVFDFIRYYRESNYRRNLSHDYVHSPEQIERLVSAFNSSSSPLQYFANLRQALGFCPLSELRALLRKHLLPSFFRAYPEGKLAVVATDYRYEELSGVLRALFTLSHIGESTVMNDNIDSFPALRRWEPLSVSSMTRTLLAPFGYLWYPLVHAFHTGMPGLDFLFILDPPVQSTVPAFPSSWSSILRKNSLFGQQDINHFDAITNPMGSHGQQSAHRRFLHEKSFSADQILNLLNWYIERINVLVYQSTDVANFTEGLNPTSEIDPVFCFEHFLTISRLLRRIIATISAEEGSYAKTFTFEVADLLDTLSELFGNTPKKSTEFFKRLFNPSTAPSQFQLALSKLPPPFDSYSIDIVRQLYSELDNVVLKSVWIPSKRTPNGVLVRNKQLSAEVEEQRGEFVSNVMRAYRNGHHGHFSIADTSKRPSRYLALVDGDVPDSISALPVFWLLAYLSDPSIVGWKPLQIQGYD